MTQKTPDAPSWLCETARKRWIEIWAVVDPESVRPEIHGDTVALYCSAFATLVAATENIEAAGVLSNNGDKTVANPYVAIRDRAAKVMMKLAPDLGLSPGVGKVIWPTKAVK